MHLAGSVVSSISELITARDRGRVARNGVGGECGGGHKQQPETRHLTLSADHDEDAGWMAGWLVSHLARCCQSTIGVSNGINSRVKVNQCLLKKQLKELSHRLASGPHCLTLLTSSHLTFVVKGQRSQLGPSSRCSNPNR